MEEYTAVNFSNVSVHYLDHICLHCVKAKMSPSDSTGKETKYSSFGQFRRLGNVGPCMRRMKDIVTTRATALVRHDIYGLTYRQKVLWHSVGKESSMLQICRRQAEFQLTSNSPIPDAMRGSRARKSNSLVR